MKPIELAERLSACPESMEFVSQFDTIEEAWNACLRGDWMLWVAAKLHVDLQTLTLAKGLCANTARHLMKDPRSMGAVDAAIAFGRGEIDRKVLDAAAHAAAAAYDAAYDAAYVHSAYVRAAAAAYAAAYAAADTADTAAAAAYGAAYAAAAAAATGKQNRQQTADICRKILTEVVFKRIGGLDV